MKFKAGISQNPVAVKQAKKANAAMNKVMKTPGVKANKPRKMC